MLDWLVPQSFPTNDDLAALDAALQIMRSDTHREETDHIAYGAIISRLPRALAAARQAKELRAQLVQALAWLQAWSEGADLSEIEIFALRHERLMEFTRHAQALLDGVEPSSALDEAAALS